MSSPHSLDGFDIEYVIRNLFANTYLGCVSETSTQTLFERAAALIEAAEKPPGAATPAVFSIQAWKEAYPTIWAAVLKELGVADEKAFKYIKSGKNGSAYYFGDREVVKFTADTSEAESMALLVGEDTKFIVHVTDVFWLVKDWVACVRQERLEAGEPDWKEFGDIATFYFSVIVNHAFHPLAVDQFKDWCKLRLGVNKNQPKAATINIQADDSTPIDIKRAPKSDKPKPGAPRPIQFVHEKNPNRALDPKFMNPNAAMPTDDKFEWFRGLCEELISLGISFYDLNAGNIMKRGNVHVVIDLGESDRMQNKPIKVLDINNTAASVLRVLATRVETVVAETVPDALRGKENLWRQLAARVGHNPDQTIKALGEGTKGTAYLLSNNTVLKITGDKQEAEAAATIMGKKLKHIVEVYDVLDLHDDGLYAVTMEPLDKPEADWTEFFQTTELYFLNQLKPVLPADVRDFEITWKQNVIASFVVADGFDDWGDINPGDEVELKQNISWPARLPSQDKFLWLEGLAQEFKKLGIEFSDMNPGNIMRRKNGDHVVIDLGVSRVKTTETIKSI